jgi:hypothetical protein
VEAENIGDGGGAADHGHIAFVEIPEGRQILDSSEPRADSLGRVGATLNGDLRDAGKRLAAWPGGRGEVANNENVGIVGDGQIGFHLDAAAAVGFGFGALRELVAEFRGHHAAGPEHGPCRKSLDALFALVCDTRGVDVCHHHTLHDFHAEALD